MPASFRTAGFTLVELLVSMTITAVALACVFAVAAASREAFAVQPEAADVQQRVRVAVTMLTRDLRRAGAGRIEDDPCQDGLGAPVLPYRVGAFASDPAAGVFYRPDALSVVFREPGGAVPEIVRRTYHMKRTGPDSSQLMQYDGRQTDHPVLDDVVVLAFEYFAGPDSRPPGAVEPQPLDPTAFIDGPWCPDAASRDRFDADLLRIRRVRVRLRVQAPRPFRGPAGPLFTYEGDAGGAARIADQEVRFDVAPRNPGL